MRLRLLPFPALLGLTLPGCAVEGVDDSDALLDTSVLVTYEPPGENCPSGGVALTDASGVTEFVCNGAPGPQGNPGLDAPVPEFLTSRFQLYIELTTAPVRRPPIQIPIGPIHGRTSRVRQRHSNR
jgi:hypothetical protein